jgi:uncharacterized protein YggU (UPF0235/DUF167 family)
MARPPNVMPSTATITALADDRGILRVRVTANARENAILLPVDSQEAVLRIQTTRTPEHGRANKAVLALLARALGRSPSSMSIVRGASSRDKMIDLRV